MEDGVRALFSPPANGKIMDYIQEQGKQSYSQCGNKIG
jgi:hypothetical protein